MSPQYHVIFDEGFDTAFSEDSEELQNKIFHSLLEFNQDQKEWLYADQFDKDTSRHFFDASWDIDAIYEELKHKKKVVSTVLAREIRRNAVLRKKLGLQKDREGALPTEDASNISVTPSNKNSTTRSSAKKRRRST